MRFYCLHEFQLQGHQAIQVGKDRIDALQIWVTVATSAPNVGAQGFMYFDTMWTKSEFHTCVHCAAISATLSDF